MNFSSCSSLVENSKFAFGVEEIRGFGVANGENKTFLDCTCTRAAFCSTDFSASKYPILGVGLRRPDGLKPFPWLDVSILDFRLSQGVPSVTVRALGFVIGGWSLLFLVEGDSEDDLVLKLSDVWLTLPIVDAVETPEITELMLSTELLGEMVGDALSILLLVTILFLDAIAGSTLLIPALDDERIGTL
jgi:hypothetical protein